MPKKRPWRIGILTKIVEIKFQTKTRPLKYMEKINKRITKPTPDEVRLARENANLTQTQAAELVSAAKIAGYKTWAAYETKPLINGIM